MLKNLFNSPKSGRIHHRQRQRQKMSRKMIIILGSSIACLTIALIIVMNVSNVDKAQAALQGSTSSQVVIIPDQVYATEVSAGQAAARTAAIAPDVQLGHTAKPLQISE